VPVIFVHVTIVPTETVSVAGLKAKDPELSVMMVTFFVGPEVVVVGVDAAVVGVVVLPTGVLVVGVGAAVDPVVPQAASRTRAPSVNTQNQLRV
jgi:hypothetical protein